MTHQAQAPLLFQWRKPTNGEKACDTCGQAAGNALGPPLRAKETWFCMGCTPADFWPSRRAGEKI